MMMLRMNVRRGVAAWMGPTRTPVRPYRACPSLWQRKSSPTDDDDGWGGPPIIRKPVEDRPRAPPDRAPRRFPDRGTNRDGRGPRNGSGNRDRGDWRSGREDRNERGGDRRVFDRRNNSGEKWDRNGPGNRGPRGKVEDPASKIDIKGLEAEGFVHLYGLAPILSALKSGQRDFSPRENEEVMLKERFGELYNNDATSQSKTPQKPEAQYTPWLFLQDRTGGGESGRTKDKMSAADEVEKLAGELGIPVAYTDKGSLNALSGNRPHQGFVLRCGALEFEPLSRIPLPDLQDPSIPKLWLVLDEVVDPQNLGALLRSSYFLGGNDNNPRIGIVVCAKNSAPPSPVVSAASAGALELLDVYSTSSLPRTLASALDDGFRIIGAASSKPRAIQDDDRIEIHDLQNLPLDDRPTILVLGSEGHGLRTLVAKLCTDLVRIPRGDGLGVEEDGGDEEGDSSPIVDSLNVSVTGGILLWHLLYGSKL